MDNSKCRERPRLDVGIIMAYLVNYKIVARAISRGRMTKIERSREVRCRRYFYNDKGRQMAQHVTTSLIEYRVSE